MNKNIKYRGLYRISGWIFIVWGFVAAVKGLLDAVYFSPDSEFIALAKWIKYATFEVIYGMACIFFGLFLFELSKHLRETIETGEEQKADVPHSA